MYYCVLYVISVFITCFVVTWVGSLGRRPYITEHTISYLSYY